MPFASRDPRALVLAFAPSLLCAVAILQCSSDAMHASAATDGGGKAPTSEDAQVLDGGPPIVRVDVARNAPVSADLGLAVAANNAFAIDLYRQALPLADGGNFLTSPFSANLALTM